MASTSRKTDYLFSILFSQNLSNSAQFGLNDWEGDGHKNYNLV